MERALRELDELDRRLGQTHRVAPILEVQPSRTPRRPGRFLPLTVALLVTIGVVRLVGGGSDDGMPGFLDRLAGAAGSLSGGLEHGLVPEEAASGEQVSGGSGYTFARVQPDGVAPVTWPCEGRIPIEVNPEGAPEDYESLISSAVARANAASGFRFEVVGESGDRDFLERGRGPVLLGFADETEVEMLEGVTAGIGGSTYAWESSGGPVTAVGGVVVLDTDVVDRADGRAEVILLHELAHVLGLGHTDTQGELMQAMGTRQGDFGPGDLAGLAHLRESACS